MVPVPCPATAPVPPPSYQRTVAKRTPALHIDAVTLITRLHLLALCQLAVTLARRQSPPPSPKGPGGAPQTYSAETLPFFAPGAPPWPRGFKVRHSRLAPGPALAPACAPPTAHI